ncbi:CbtB-domain containing protein [Rhodococcus sp. W8901]|nr:CbtB-domain containing protein [Rhodococcus sp. W8901]
MQKCARQSDGSTEPAAIGAITVAVVLHAMLALYLVGFDQGAISRSGMYMHKLMHDGRHLLGLPCH